MKRYALVLVFLYLACIAAHGQAKSGRIHGIVETSPGYWEAGAMIKVIQWKSDGWTLKPIEQTLYSDNRGEFEVEVTSQLCDVVVLDSSLESKAISIRVPPGDLVKLKIRLKLRKGTQIVE